MRDWRTVLALMALLAAAPLCQAFEEPLVSRPNVILIMTDDQGYGDLGFHGNPRIRTPHLDRLASESVRLAHFYVSPVCSPTRASLLTGRYNYRTGVVDTYQGRSLMHPDEITLAERLSSAGYRTGIFGKWHLGDNVPLRPIDQGFQEALVLKGGGIGQPSDLPGGSHYQDPVLLHNGQAKHFKGYCSDVYTSAAIDFIASSDERPFFTYLAFNCPHDPLEAPARELAEYQGSNLGPDDFPRRGNPLPRSLSHDRIARVYAMVSNIDSNIGRLLEAIEKKGLARSTIVVFLTDNGPAFPRYNGGLRGLKGTVYEGGIRVPCFVRWPGRFPADREVDTVAAHIDIAPTLLEVCGVPAGDSPGFDGRSLVPLLTGDGGVGSAWPQRTLYFQWHRGDAPEPGRAFAARSQRYKLLCPEPPAGKPRPPLELYDLESDPFEQHDLATERPQIVAQMFKGYQDWFKDVSSTRGFAPIRIQIGGPRENPTLLTPQDRRGPGSDGEENRVGHWELNVVQAGRYDITLTVPETKAPATLHIVLGDIARRQPLKSGRQVHMFRDLDLKSGPARLQAWISDERTKAAALNVTFLRLEGGE